MSHDPENPSGAPPPSGAAHGHAGPPHHSGGAHEEHEGAPEWLISFADNVMLQMGFFVILLALNLKPEPPLAGGHEGDESGEGRPPAALLDGIIAIREAFHNPVELNSTNPNDRLLVERLRWRLSGASNDQGQEGRDQDVRTIRRSDRFGQGGTVPFEDQQATLGDDGRQAALQVCERIRGLRYIVELRGHVSAAEAYDQADRGMRLAYERAKAVAELLASSGIGWEQVRIVACGANDRVSPVAYDKAGHRANQRVEIIVTDEVLQDYANDPGPPAAAPKP